MTIECEVCFGTGIATYEACGEVWDEECFMCDATGKVEDDD